LSLFLACTAGAVHFRNELPLWGLSPFAAERYLRMKNEYMDAWARYAEASQWIGANLPADTVVTCRAPQHTYVMSGRKSWRYDVPEVPGTNLWDRMWRMSDRRTTALIEDAFPAYAGAPFSYGASRADAMMPVLAGHEAELAMVYETAAPTTRVWRVVGRP
jgi:hypothetical protein